VGNGPLIVLFDKIPKGVERNSGKSLISGMSLYIWAIVVSFYQCMSGSPTLAER